MPAATVAEPEYDPGVAVRRRELLAAAITAPLLGHWWSALALEASGVASPFDADTVAGLAKALAARDYVEAESALPRVLEEASYDAYRDFRYRADHALWREEGDARFQAQFFHRGFLFRPKVDIHVVDGGQARALPFSTELFDYAPNPAPVLDDIGFAGFRLHAPLNRADYFDELCVFLGASYFRAVGRGLGYGLSARGLALGTGEPAAEEFPAFRAFWLHRPDAGSQSITIDALLDSPSVAGAFRFVVTPGEDTVFDVDARLYPRVALEKAGIAPLTSMFHFDASGRRDVDDYRPAVHDSDGLAVFTRTGEQVWRPLHNPRAIQHSGFQGEAPVGFGLMQRKRGFADYADIEARYHHRPSLWIEPRGDWGKGAVMLVELSTNDEIHDNIVAFWRPETPAAAAAGASAMLEPTEGNQTRGELRFAAVGDRIEVTGTISGLPGNSTHGFHVHETGDCSAPDATSAGGHFNPAGTEHGRVGQDAHHAGDSDNITADADGNATVQGWLEGATVGDGAATDIVGKAVIVHADADDYVTQPTGNAGDRLACGVIAAR